MTGEFEGATQRGCILAGSVIAATPSPHVLRLSDLPENSPKTEQSVSSASSSLGLTSSEVASRPSSHGGDKRIVDTAEETLRTFSLTHNYNLWVVHLLTPYLGKRILEIGCGIGNLTLYLQHFGDLSCVDVSELYLSHMRIDFPEVGFYRYDAGGDDILALSRQQFDTVTCVNVLEHIENDERAARNAYRILAPGGRFLVYVPALQSLYSSIDRNLDHFRRYGKRQLDVLLRRAGFQVEKLVYSNLIGTLGWFLNGKVQRKRQLSIWQTILFDKFVPVVERLERYLHPCFGMSLLAVARKPPTQCPDQETARDDSGHST